MLGALALLACPAAAQRLEFFQGPVVSSGRVIGLGGAYIAVAEGADGHLVNPVAYTLRPAYGLDDHFDWDATLSWLNVTSDELDIDQSGQEDAFDSGSLMQVGGNLKFGRHGFGFQVAVQQYDLTIVENEIRAEAAAFDQTFTSVGYAYAALEGQLLLGGALGAVGASVGPQDDTETDEKVSISGVGLLFGALWAPHGEPYRVGVTARSHTLGDEAEGQTSITTLPPPEQITAPWELGIGAAWQFGPRPLNPRPSFGDWEDTPGGTRPVRTMPRRYVLIAADLILTGASGEGTIGAQSYLRGREQPAGRNATISARLGAESEIIGNWLRLRGGTYFEPSRFEAGGRVHGTAGFDVHVPLIWDLRVNAVIDATVGYLNWGLGVGFWH